MEYAQKLISTRGGTLVMAGIAALIAAIAVFVYVTNYRDSVKSGGTPAQVLVATNLIPKGTPGEAVARTQPFQVQEVRESQVLDGALTDPAALRDRTAVADVYPGQQLTASDFATSGSALANTLAGAQRAITIPLDSAHGIVNYLRAGDHVDVYAAYNVGNSRPVLRLIMQNVQVVEVQKASESTSRSSAQLTMRVRPQQAADLAFASDFGGIWFTLRPASGAKSSPPSLVTVETQMLGIPPVQVLRSLGGRK